MQRNDIALDHFWNIWWYARQRLEEAVDGRLR